MEHISKVRVVLRSTTHEHVLDEIVHETVEVVEC